MYIKKLFYKVHSVNIFDLKIIRCDFRNAHQIKSILNNFVFGNN